MRGGTDDRLVAILAGLHVRTGDRRYAAACRALRGGGPGRRSIDDAHRLELVATLVEEAGLSHRRAAMTVAAFTAGNHSISATADRLRKKLAGRKNKSQAKP